MQQETMETAAEDFETALDSAEPEGAGGHFEAPEGFELVSDDIAGYWDASCTPMEFYPESFRLMDNTNQGSQSKSSALIVGKLAKSATLVKNTAKKEERHKEVFEAGTVVGIWAKPAMKQLGTLKGCHVWIAPAGKREMGAGKNDMQLFDIGVSAKTKPLMGQKLELTEDVRNKSLREPIRAKEDGGRPPWWLDVAYEDGGLSLARGAAKRAAAAESEDTAAAAMIS